MCAAVSGPISSGLANGMSPWFSTISPSKPAVGIGAGVGERAVVDRFDARRMRSRGRRAEAARWTTPIRTPRAFPKRASSASPRLRDAFWWSLMLLAPQQGCSKISRPSRRGSGRRRAHPGVAPTRPRPAQPPSALRTRSGPPRARRRARRRRRRQRRTCRALSRAAPRPAAFRAAKPEPRPRRPSVTTTAPAPAGEQRACRFNEIVAPAKRRRLAPVENGEVDQTPVVVPRRIERRRIESRSSRRTRAQARGRRV